MKRLFWIAATILALVVTACSTTRMAPSPAMPESSRMYGSGGAAPDLQFSEAAPAAPAPANDAAKAAVESPAGATSDNSPAGANRLVVETASLSIVVKDVNAHVQAIQAMARSMGGYPVSVNVSQTYTNSGDKVPQAQVVVRVPVEKLDDAMKQVKDNTVEVQTETSSGVDVTDQYIDLQSRLAAKQAAEAQLLKIMQQADKTEDVLAVYNQLETIQSDIEVLKGQIKYTEQSAALSSLTVTIIAEETIQPIKVGGWEPQGVARDALQSLIYFWQDFVNFLIRFFLYTLPVLITVAIPLFLIFLLGRWVFRKLRKPKAKPVEEAK